MQYYILCQSARNFAYQLDHFGPLLRNLGTLTSWNPLSPSGGPGSSVGIATDYELGGPGSNPGGDEIFPPFQTGPGAHPASCTMGTGTFPGVKCGQGVLLTTHPILLPRSWKSTAIPLPIPWATPGL